MKKDLFSKLPTKLFLPTNRGESILKQTDDNLSILVIEYLYNTTIVATGVSALSIKDIIETVGLEYNDDSIKRVRKILQKLKTANAIISNVNITKVAPSHYQTCYLNVFVTDGKGNEMDCISIYEKDKQSIMSYSDNYETNLNLLALYGWILSHGYSYGIASEKYKDVCSDIGLESDTVKEFLKTLELLELNI